MTTMTMTAASFASLDAPARRNRSVWRRFFDRVMQARTPKAEDQIADYIRRHYYDLPPQVRIELERRYQGA